MFPHKSEENIGETHLSCITSECETYYLVSLLLWLVNSDPEMTKGILEGIRRYPVENGGNMPVTRWEGRQGK